MTCKMCGSPIDADDRFCPQCGNAVQQETDAFEQVSPNSDSGNGGVLKIIGTGFSILIIIGLIVVRAVMSRQVKSMNETSSKLMQETNTLLKKRFQDLSTPALNELFGMRLGAKFDGDAMSSDSTNVLVGVFFPKKNSIATNTLFSAGIGCQDINSVDFSAFLVFLSKDKRIQAVRAVAEFQGDTAKSEVDEKCDALIDQICTKLNRGAHYDSAKITKEKFRYLKEADEEVWGIQCKSSPLPQDITISPHYNLLLIAKGKVEHNTYFLKLDLGYESYFKEMSKEQSAKSKEPTEGSTDKVVTQVNTNVQLEHDIEDEKPPFVDEHSLASHDSRSICTNVIGDVTWEYVVEHDEVTIKKCTFEDNRGVVVPATLDDRPVTRIGDGAFEDRANLLSIVLPKSVTSLGNGCFFGCRSLTNITIPESVTSIGSQAFGFSGLTNVIIPPQVATIEFCTFGDCRALTHVTIGKGVKNIELSAFTRSGLVEVTIPDNVTNIESQAFAFCSKLSNVTIGSGVRAIGMGAFSCCGNLSHVTVGVRVKDISSMAFGYCGLNRLTFKGNMPVCPAEALFGVDTQKLTVFVPQNADGWDRIAIPGTWHGATIRHLSEDKQNGLPSKAEEKESDEKTEDKLTKILEAGIRKAAEQGDAKAQYKLGCSYLDGVGVAQDQIEGVMWLRKAAEQGEVEAQFRLGGCYFQGKGVKIDEQKALMWIRKSAEQGKVRAQFTLALFYMEGYGTQKNIIEAVSWFRKAAKEGYEPAIEKLRELGLDVK